MKLDLPHVLKVLDDYEDEKHYIYVNEYFPKSGLQLQSIRQDEDQVRGVARALLNTIMYCHELDIIHTDIGLNNILFASLNQFKIRNFWKGEETKELYRNL